jgi:hypothetical protein
MKLLLTAVTVFTTATFAMAGSTSFPAKPNKSALAARLKPMSGADGSYIVKLPATAVSKLDNGDMFSLYGYVFTKINGQAKFAFENSSIGLVCTGDVSKSGTSESSCKHNGKLITRSTSSVKSGSKTGDKISPVKDLNGKTIGKTIVSWSIRDFPDAKTLLNKLK